MIEVFAELMLNGKPHLEQVYICPHPTDQSLGLLRLAPFATNPKCRPTHYRDMDQCKYTWDALLAAQHAIWADKRYSKFEPDLTADWHCKDNAIS